MPVRIRTYSLGKYIAEYVHDTYGHEKNTYTTVFVRIPYVLRTYSYVSVYVSVRIAYVSPSYSYVFVRIFSSTQSYVFVRIRKYHVRILIRIPYVFFKLPSWCSLHKTGSRRPPAAQASSGFIFRRAHIEQPPRRVMRSSPSLFFFLFGTRVVREPFLPSSSK